MALMFVTGASIVLSILFGMMVAALLNRARGREMIVSIMIGQLSSVIYQFIFMVAYGLLIQPRNRDILLDRGIGVRSMVDARNISSVFKGILPFRFDGKHIRFFLWSSSCFSAWCFSTYRRHGWEPWQGLWGRTGGQPVPWG